MPIDPDESPSDAAPTPVPDLANSPPTPVAPPAIQSPDHRDMYLLIAGLIIGLALSPWVLGRVLDAPAFDRWYFGGGQPLTDYESFIHEHETQRKAKFDEQIERLKSTGATKDAVDEMRDNWLAEGQEERRPYTEAIQGERESHAQWYRGVMLSLVAAAVVLMFLEPLFDLPGPLAPVRRRLVTGRYALLALWLAFALAKPDMVAGIAWLFLILMVIVAVAAAVVPQALKTERA